MASIFSLRPNRWVGWAASLGLALTVAACGTPQQGTTISEHVSEASERFDVPQQWIYEVMRVESGMRTHFGDGRLIESHAGAMGLMQVMPGTYAELRRRYGLGSNPHDPRDNILAGTAYIREMYDMFGAPGFLGAYNAGPGRYLGYLNGDRTLPGETRRYMAMIAPRIDGVYPSGDSPRVTPTAVGEEPPAEAIYAQATPPLPPSNPTTPEEIPDHLTTFQIRMLYPHLVSALPPG